MLTFHGHSSATTVLRMPTFPFPRPCTARAVIAMGRLVENPQTSIMVIVLTRPSRIMGLRPKRSEAAPQAMLVKPWQMQKMAVVRPAHQAMLFTGTPKDSIISGRYGFTDVRAMGSAKRHIATGLG